MVVRSVEIENFGPYYGTHELAFEPNGRPVTLIHGENEAGKTSLLNAIRWALYGYAKDRFGRRMPIRKLLNDDAYEEGQRRVTVRLHLMTEEGGERHEYRLRRQSQAREGIADALDDSDYEEYIDIERDGNVVVPSQFDDIVNTLLPEEISRFFLFDGELLREYEELVREEGDIRGETVKQAIEMILGVPAATKGRDDIRAIREEVAKKLRREAKRHREAADAATQLELAVEERRRYLDDRDDTAKQLKDAHAELNSLEDKLARYESIREDAGRVAELRRVIDQLVIARTGKRRERRELVRQLWRDALHPRLRHELERLEVERTRISSELSELADAQRRLVDVSQALDEDKCGTCGQPLPEDAASTLRREREGLKRKVDELEASASSERQEELTRTIAQLRDVAPAGITSAIRVLEADLRDNTRDTYKAEQEIDRLLRRAKGLDPTVVADYERKRKELIAHMTNVENQLRDLDRLITQRESEIDALERRIREHDVPALRRLNTELEILHALEALFDKTIDDLVNELRIDVEREATEIFRELSADKTYHGLQINERYGLTIVMANGKTKDVRSAGAEQVVALSLIGALNRLATKRGPVIMDTPFGRLDRRHRGNILNFVPTLADQVVLLVHTGELDPERDLDQLAAKVGGEYTIAQLESTKSELRKGGTHV